MDEWGAGSYEETAKELAPTADVAVDALGIQAGEHVLDVACGTGNGAAVAAAAGARVTGLDASPRLLEAARERVPEGEFVHGDAAELPFQDGAFDAAVSIFGAVLADRSEQAVCEMARVVRPGGRLAITSWVPRGPVSGAIGAIHRIAAHAHADAAPRPDWSDRAVLERVLGPFGEIDISEQALAADPLTHEERWERWARSHPMWIRLRERLEPATWERLREEALEAMRAAQRRDGPESPYLLTVLRRSS